MYNLFVSGDKSAWRKSAITLPRIRCVHEFTDPEIQARFYDLLLNADELKCMPCLFAYEREHDQEARIGFITHLSTTDLNVRIQFKFAPRAPIIPASLIDDLGFELGIDDYNELARTHWAIKDKDLFAALKAKGVTDIVNPGEAPPPNITKTTFEVALSFPGEIRAFVEVIANELKAILGEGHVFYDNFYMSQLARPNLDTLLQAIYRERSNLVVVFLCKAFEEKEWCGVEFRAVRDIIKARSSDKVMFIRYDQSKVTGVFSTDGYIDAARHTQTELARMIAERVQLNRQ